MRISRAAGLYARPEPWEVSWDALAGALLAPPHVSESKMGVPLWSPAERVEGATTREARHVLRLHAGVLDVDGVGWEILSQARERLDMLGCAAVIHSSHGAAGVFPGRTKFRIVVPLANAVSAAGWGKAWPRIANAICPQADPAAKDVGRMYFLPSAPPNAPPGSVYAWSREGVALDLGTLDDGPVEVSRPARKVTIEDLRDVWRAWGRRKSRGGLRIRRALAALIEGEPYAEEGERDQISFELAADLTREIPDADPEGLAALFAPSLGVMGPGAPTVALIAQKAHSARRRHEEAAREAARPIGPKDEPFVLCTPTGGAWYVRAQSGDWQGPYTGEAVDAALRQGLAWAADLGVSLDKPGPEGGSIGRSRGEVLTLYGRALASHVLELGAARSRLEGDRFVEAACVPRHLEPARSEVVDEWLDLLFGAARDDVRTWLSIAPDLREPLAALYMVGARGVGKSLFAQGVSRIWTLDGPTPAKILTGDYNGAILRCPLIFADEYLPAPRRRGESATGVLREIIQARTHLIERKYLPDVDARGCVRLLVAANDDQVLTFDDDMGPEDALAVAERFYVATVLGRAKAWIEEDRTRVRSILDELAPHALWLAAQVRPEKTHRFWVQGGRDHAEGLSIRGGLRSEACRYLVTWLTTPRNTRSGDRTHIATDGAFLVSTQDMHATWELLIRDSRPPKITDLTRAMRVIAPSQRRVGGCRYWEVDLRRLQIWADAHSWNVQVAELVERANKARVGRGAA